MTTNGGSSSAVRYVLINWLSFTTLLGALIVLLPFHLTELGLGVDAIAAVSAAAGVGGVVSADVVGRVAVRFGAVRLVRGGIAVMGFSVVGIGLSESFVPFLLLHGAIGVATSMVRVGSQMVVRNRVNDDRRGRVHAWQGLTSRIGFLVVPIGAGVLWELLEPEWSFVALTVTAAVIAFLAGSLAVAPPAPTAPQPESTMPWPLLLRYASGPLLFVASRAGRMLLLPLIGLELELSPSRIGALVGLSAAADVIIAPVSGPIMDTRGRLATILPSFGLTAIGFVMLAMASGGWLLGSAAVVLGIGNGLSAGLLLTISTDLAPPGAEGQFLGRFGAMSDFGRLLGPFVVGLLGEWLGLNSAAFALAATTTIGLFLIVVFVGETRPSDTSS